MRIGRRLERWQAEGLIDAPTAGRIARWEEAHRPPLVAPVLATLGAGTVALGVVALVAANWEAIPGRVKIGADLTAMLALAAATFVALRRGARLTADALVVVLWGFTLASIALVGQVYQVDAPLWRALVAWTVSTGPLVLLARSGPASGLVVLGLLATHLVGLAALVEWLFEGSGLSRWNAANAATVLVAATPLPWIALGRARGFAERHPGHAAMAVGIGWSTFAILALAATFAWYQRGGEALELGWSLPVIGAMLAGFVAFLPSLHPGASGRMFGGIAVAATIAWLSLLCGRIPGRDAMPAVAAIAQVGILAALAWTSARAGQARLFRVLSAFVGLRIFEVYLEVFGSLLQTGIGLVVGGLLLLALTWAWNRRSGDVARRIAAGTGDGPGNERPGAPGADR